MAEMNPVAWMTAAGLGSCLLLSWFVEARIELVLGLVGPLAAAGGSWLVVERTFIRSPERLNARMIVSFAGKMAFFAVYVTVILGGFSLNPVPFVVSFSSYFVALHLTEAAYLRRLFSGGVRR